MQYENLFLSNENDALDKDIERYLIDKSIPMFSTLGRIRKVYLDYGLDKHIDGKKLFEKDLNEYIKQQKLQ